jgi:hypothetical protein
MDALAKRVRMLVSELDAERERRLVAQASEHELQKRVAELESSQSVSAMQQGSLVAERDRLAAQVQAQELELSGLQRRVDALEREKRSLEHRLRAQGVVRGVGLETALQQREAALERLARLNDELVEQVRAQAQEVARIRGEAAAAAETAHSAGRDAAARAARLEGEVERLRAEVVSREQRAAEVASSVATESTTARKRAADMAAERDLAVRQREEAEGAARVATQELRNALRRARQGEEELAKSKEEAAALRERAETLDRRAQTLQQRVAQLGRRATRADDTQKRVAELERALKHAEGRRRTARDVPGRAEGGKVVAMREALRQRAADLADALEKEHTVLAHNRALAARCQFLEDTLDRAGVLLARTMARCDGLQAERAGSAASASAASAAKAPSSSADPAVEAILQQQTQALRAAVASLHSLQTRAHKDAGDSTGPAAATAAPADPLHGQLRLLREQMTALEAAVGRGVREGVIRSEEVAEARAEAAQWKSEALALRRALARLELPSTHPPTLPHPSSSPSHHEGEELGPDAAAADATPLPNAGPPEAFH